MTNPSYTFATSESSPLLTLNTSQQITFHAGPASAEIMRLDEMGMTYKGQRIEDGGEAHRTFLEVMNQMRLPQVSA